MIENTGRLKIFYQLISKISEIQQENLQGCIMTTAKFVWKEELQGGEYKVQIVHESEMGAAIKAWGIKNTGEVVQSLHVKLMKKRWSEKFGGDGREKQNEKWEPIIGQYKECTQIQGNEAELEEYLRKVGDTNEIHRGKKAVMPGLYIVWICLKKCETFFEKYERVHVRFIKPVYVGNRIQVYKKEGLMEEQGIERYREQLFLIVTNQTVAAEIKLK